MSTLELSHAPLWAILRRSAANLITAARVVLLFLVAAFAVTPIPFYAVVAVPLALVTLLMDWLDGVAARHWGSESKLGGLLDIAGDRLVENVWWVVFAWLQLIPLWVPLVVLSRGFITDAVRSYALSRGFTAFGRESMMRSRVGHFLVASRFSRGTYCAAKVVAFALLFALNAAQHLSPPADPGLVVLGRAAYAGTLLAVALCLVRGVPVVAEFRRFLREEEGH